MPRPIKKFKSLEKEMKNTSIDDIEDDDNDEVEELDDMPIIESVIDDDEEPTESSFFQVYERESWIDNKENIKFKPGNLVIGLTGKGPIYKIGPPSTEYNTYFATQSGVRDSIVIKGERFKLAPKSATWVPYKPT